MKILVCGGRNFDNHTELYDCLDDIHEQYGISMIISGMAKGADTLAVDWAEHSGIDIDPYPAKWKDLDVPGAVIKTNKYGDYNATAGHIRNALMISQGKPDGVVHTPGGSGTADMVNRARKAGIPLRSLIEFISNKGEGSKNES